MKRYALISVLLLVAFTWSCKNKSSSPYTPEDLTTLVKDGESGTVTVAGKGGNGQGKGPVEKTATYTIDVYFATVLVGTGVPGPPKPSGLRDDHMLLDLRILNSLNCFEFTLSKVEGIFAIIRGSKMGFWFDENDCDYIMWMPNAEIIAGDWPPALVGDTTTFKGSELNVVDPKDKCDNACEGTVSVSWEVIVTRTN